ncbi:nucleotidyltransferase domain-containing protein [Candidatus Pacearchaeota archaeon]|nr:nucleotidyltransferase domain-containing protein [Candidatus Pacearchaeota archaeon]
MDNGEGWDKHKEKERNNWNRNVASNIPDEIRAVLPVPEEQLIVFMKFGSHLYGMNTPDSDTDYKGIYLPTRKQILEGDIPKAASYKTKSTKEEGVRNGKDDIDLQIFSLHHFMKLAMKGETVALDMMHAPAEWPLVSSDIWDTIQRLRGKFYTKNLKSFVSYARKQAAKYGIKGSRLADIKKVMEFFDEKIRIGLKCLGDLEPMLLDVWDELPTGAHIHKLDDDIPAAKMYQVAGKKFGGTCKLSYVYPILGKYYDQYGHRAKQAEENKGIDWKAVSHALRAAMQVSELLSTGSIQYPLRAAPLLTEIKQGKRDYKRHVAPLLEMYMNQCEKLSGLSNYPEKCDQEFWLKFLRQVVKSSYGWK